MKKIVGLFLIFIFIITILPICNLVFAQSGDVNIDFFRSLNIIEQDNIEKVDVAVTRATALRLIVKSLNISPNYLTAEKSVFSDLNTSHNDFQYIMWAYNNKIISKSQDELFRPDDFITFDQLVKIAVCIIGADFIAEDYGGYPTGYLSIAQRYKILNGMSNSGNLPLDLKSVLQLIYNTIHTGKIEPSTFSNTSMSYIQNKNITILSVNWNLLWIDDIVTNDGTVVVNNMTTADNQIAVGNKHFIYEEKFNERLVGKRVRLYYDKSTENADIPTAKYIFAEKYIQIELDAKWLTFENFTFKYLDDNDKKSNYRLDKDNTMFFYNDTLLTVEPFVPVKGRVFLIDNNLDGVYDYAFIKENTDVVMLSYDILADTLMFKENNVFKTICIDEYDKVFVLNSKGNQILLSSITTNTPVSLFMPFGNQKTLLSVHIGNTVSGTVKELLSNEIITDDLTSLKTENGFINDVAVGYYYDFYVNTFGKVFSAELINNVNNKKIGYISGFSTGGGLYLKSQIKILTKKNKFEIYNISPRLTIVEHNSGVTACKSSEEAIKKLSALYGVAIYDENNGELKKITMLEYSGECTDEQHKLNGGVCTFTDGYFKILSSSTIEKSGNNLSNKTTIDSSTVCFVVKNGVVYPKDSSEILVGASELLSSNSLTSLDVYVNINKPYSAAIAIKKSDDVSTEFSQNTEVYSVGNIALTLNNDEQVVNSLTLVSGNTTSKYLTVDSNIAKNIKIGDIIRVKFGKDNAITKIELCYSVKNNFNNLSNVFNNLDGVNQATRLYLTDPYEIFDNYLANLVGSFCTKDTSLADANMEFIDINKFKIIIIEDKPSGITVRNGGLSDIKTYKTSNLYRSKIICWTSYMAPRTIFVIN